MEETCLTARARFASYFENDTEREMTIAGVVASDLVVALKHIQACQECQMAELEPSALMRHYFEATLSWAHITPNSFTDPVYQCEKCRGKFMLEDVLHCEICNPDPVSILDEAATNKTLCEHCLMRHAREEHEYD